MSEMERKVYRIGSGYGIAAYMDVETKKVLAIMYNSPYEGGVLYSSPDGVKEVSGEALKYLKRHDDRVYHRVMNIKKGKEDFVRYAWYDPRVHRFETISDEKWARKWESSKNIVDFYKTKGYELRPYSLKDNPHEAITLTFPMR